MPREGSNAFYRAYADRWYLDKANKDLYLYRSSSSKLGLNCGLVVPDLETLDGIDLSVHAADADAHHAEEIPDGRALYGTTTLISIPGVALAAVATLSATGGNIYYFPIKVVTTVTYDLMVAEVTTAASAGKKLRLGIYNADVNWQPTSLVVDAGEVAADSNAVVTKSITQTLAAGRYLLAMAVQETTVLRAMQGGTRYVGVRPTLGSSPYVMAGYVTKTYGAFSTTGTAWDTVWVGTVPFYYALFLQASTP